MNKLVSGAIGIPVHITGTRINLPDILELKGKRIKHIDVADMVQQTVAGHTGIGTVENYVNTLKSSFLTLQEQNTHTYKVNRLSLNQLTLSQNFGNRLFINKIIDFPNSFIDFPNYYDRDSAGNEIYKNKVIFLVFWYDEPLIMQRIEVDGKITIQNFEVNIVSTTSHRISFGDNRTLVGAKFRNIFYQSLTDNGKTPSGKISVSYEDSQKSFMNLQVENLKYFRNVPVYLFYQQENYFPIRLQNITFDFLNSYIEVAPSVTLASNSCFFFNAEIDDND